LDFLAGFVQNLATREFDTLQIRKQALVFMFGESRQ
jgi:hypothetical protein